jgi:tetratricopeptide (TPR) repeat protein
MKLILLLFCCCSLPLFGEEASFTFEKATQLAQSGKINDAVSAFETLADGNQSSAAVLYNLGNCYHSIGDHGRAIFAYERARLLTPRDSDLLGNLELSRKAANASAAPTTQGKWGGIADSLSRHEWSKLLVFSAWIVAICVMLVFLKKTLSSSWRKGIVACAVLFAILIGLASWSLHLRKSEITRAVVVTKTSLLLSPFATSDIRSNCEAGSMIAVQQQHQDYYFVNLLGTEISGWISRRDAEKIYP